MQNETQVDYDVISQKPTWSNLGQLYMPQGSFGRYARKSKSLL